MNNRVILRRCEEYDPERIARIISEGIEDLGVKPRGYTIVKPNTVIAHRRYFPHAFTRPEFLDGLFAAIKLHGQDVTKLELGERCGITIPTRHTFADAGYNPVIRRHRIKPRYFDEEMQVEIKLQSPPALRPFIYVPRSITECDFLVNAPKFKAHPWTKITLALKNYIGLQDDKHRLIDHDHMLENKVVDLQEVISPGFIAIDGITAGQKAMLTPTPFSLGLIIMGVNPVATDVVGSHIAGLDPRQVDHIRISGERGLGPLDLEDIQLSGDVSLEQAKARAEGFELTLSRVEEIFNGPRSNLTTYAGPPPDPERFEYCWGGCPGCLFESIEIVRAMQPEVYHEVQPMHIAFGDLRGTQIRAAPEERVLFIGDCVMFDGEIGGKPVTINSLYVPRDKRDPRHAKSSDLVAKILKFLALWIGHRGKQVIRVPGCPVSVAENVLFISGIGKTKMPYLDREIFVNFAYHYVIFNIVRFFRVTLPRLFRKQ
jgi:uncharacterized protein (DUF362 family)